MMKMVIRGCSIAPKQPKKLSHICLLNAILIRCVIDCYVIAEQLAWQKLFLSKDLVLFVSTQDLGLNGAAPENTIVYGVPTCSICVTAVKERKCVSGERLFNKFNPREAISPLGKVMLLHHQQTAYLAGKGESPL